jgi:hypothetical protein
MAITSLLMQSWHFGAYKYHCSLQPMVGKAQRFSCMVMPSTFLHIQPLS